MHHVIKSSNQMELPVNNGDDSKMDTNDDVSELLALSYDMTFGDSLPLTTGGLSRNGVMNFCKKKTTALLIMLIIKF